MSEMNGADIKKLVGRRVLIDVTMSGVGCDERKVIEVSPSGQRVKLDNGTNTYWEEVRAIRVVEILP
jgi:hypothetical protein